MQQTFPVILPPTKGVKLILPISPKSQQNKTRKKGASEIVDMARIFSLGLDDIKDDICVNIDGHRYEPDFAYIDKEHEICIDIEVDEPYSTNGIPTHYLYADGLNKDSERNKCFQNAGWYVCRFSEHQIFCHTSSCMKEVYKILLSNGAISEMPDKLIQAPDLELEIRWTERDSWKYIHQNYRTSYLGYNPCNMDFKSTIRCAGLTLQMLWFSIGNTRLRKELLSQLSRYFSCKKNKNKI